MAENWFDIESKKSYEIFDYMSLWDRIRKRVNIGFIDRDNTILHFLTHPEMRVYPQMYHTTGYTVSILKVPEKYLGEVEDIMEELRKALLIKYPTYENDLQTIKLSLNNLFGYMYDYSYDDKK